MTEFDAENDLDRTIDRLVDGGLSPAELRAAVARLDAAADAWKRCALAFMEAQCWTEAVRREPDRPRVAPSFVPTPAGRWRPRRLDVGLAAAAAFAAFAAGWLAGGRSERPEARVAARPRVARVEPRNERIDAVDEIESVGRPDPPPAIREVARLRFAGADGESAAEVPILAGPGLDADWLMNQPMPVSEYEQAELERRGYALDQERELVAMPLADGRRVVVPVDQVQLRYVGAVPL